MRDILETIKSYKLKEITSAKEILSLQELKVRLRKEEETPRGFVRALSSKNKKNQWGLIAELKKASPSSGLIRPDFNPGELAVLYEQGGAACLSVLTDYPFFRGKKVYLKQARMASSLPILCKDFFFDPYQVYEARLLGADCILLILAIIDDSLAREMERISHDLGMDVLIETHDEAQMERALKLFSPLIGINNRNLHTFITDFSISRRLACMVSADKILVGESGISTHVECKELHEESGIKNFLVGESLMRQKDIITATKILLGI